METTLWAVVCWGLGQQELIESFETYKEASRCAHECNEWAKHQAGDHFHTVEPIQVQA
jgi:hypothetical protein